MQKETDYTRLLNRAAKLCSSGEKCSHDIRSKLISWGMDEENTEKVISHLVKEKFIDNRRYAGYFVKDKLRLNKWGKYKIVYALRQKQIDESIINESMEEIDDEEYNRILDDLLRTKFKNLPSLESHAEKARIFRFATQRGFTTDEIYKALGRLAGG